LVCKVNVNPSFLIPMSVASINVATSWKLWVFHGTSMNFKWDSYFATTYLVCIISLLYRFYSKVWSNVLCMASFYKINLMQRIKRRSISFFAIISSSISLPMMTWCMARLLLSDHVIKGMQKVKIFDNNYVFIQVNQRCNFHLLIKVQCFGSWMDQLCTYKWLGHLIVLNIF
jgi:hypothetical protein